MTIELVAITPNAEKVIEREGRICWRTEGRMGDLTGEAFIRGLIKKGHLSVLEHACATFEVSGASRALTHQLVRHRVASFSQESQRYVPQSQFDYVVPPSIERNELAKEAYHNAMAQISAAYRTMVNLGVPGEDARYILPNGCHTKIGFTMNMRELRHTIELRCEKHAQWEIRYLFAGILGMMKAKCPNVFYDMEVDVDGCLKG